VLSLHRLLLRKSSWIELKSQRWRDNTGPICPAEDTKRISYPNILWHNPSAEWGSHFCIRQSHGLFVDSLTRVIRTSDPNKYSNAVFCFGSSASESYSTHADIPVLLPCEKEWVHGYLPA